MSESKKYRCEECKKELSISFIRLQQMLDASYKLKMQNNKLIEFVKDLADESVYERYENLNEMNWSAFELLKEIGEA